VSLALDRTGPSRLHPSGRYGIDHFFELLEKSPSAETEPWIFIRFDRFWRNARTFGSHDSLDAKNALTGSYALSGKFPPISDYFRF
jgi:hypothetical protein